MGLTDVAFTIKLAFYFKLFGFVLHTIGFGAPYWATGYNRHAGLWQFCSRSPGVCVTIDISVMNRTQVDKFLAVQVLECFGLVGSIVCLISICILIFGGRCSENRFITICNIFLFLATGTVIVIATIMFATMISDILFTGTVIVIATIMFATMISDLDWAFGLATVGGVCFSLAGICHVVFLCQYE